MCTGNPQSTYASWGAVNLQTILKLSACKARRGRCTHLHEMSFWLQQNINTLLWSVHTSSSPGQVQRWAIFYISHQTHRDITDGCWCWCCSLCHIHWDLPEKQTLRPSMRNEPCSQNVVFQTSDRSLDAWHHQHNLWEPKCHCYTSNKRNILIKPSQSIC